MQRYKKVWGALGLLILLTMACSLSATDRNKTQSQPDQNDVVAQKAWSTWTPTPLPESLIIEADAEELLLINIYERVNPAVVSIDVTMDFLDEDLSDYGSGSGFVIDKQGHIVTNSHVVEAAEHLRVTFADGRVVVAKFVAADADSDLAVLKVDVAPERLFPLELGDSGNLRVGQRVIAIGNPWELGGTMTVGIISALGRSLRGRQSLDGGFYSIPEVIQTDAAINPGNSGGPLLNSHGKVVGVNTAIRSEGRYNSGVGFAVPVDIVKRVVPSLISEGRHRYPYLGISANSFFSVADLYEELNLPAQWGILIDQVVSGGPADKAGLRGTTERVEVWGVQIGVGGDIILAIDGYELRDFDALIAYLVRETSVDQTVTLTVLRDKETIKVPLTLGERP